MSAAMPPMPPAPAGDGIPSGPPPRQITVASVLLLVNLALSVCVTVLYIVDRHAIIRMTLDHSSKLSGADARRTVTTQIWVRGVVAIAVGVLYLFLISRLRMGKRWAWRRLVWLSIIGAIGILFLLTQPYPAIFKVEQVLQLLVLAAIAVCVLHPDTRRHYAKA